MPFRINCELCGTWIEAERRSRQYCGPCRPKAVVLNSVIKNLNAAAQADPVTMDALVEQRVRMENQAMATAFPILREVRRLGVMAVLNMALSDYGSISWDGSKFEIVRWTDRIEPQEEPAPAGTFPVRRGRPLIDVRTAGSRAPNELVPENDGGGLAASTQQLHADPFFRQLGV